MLCFVRQGDSVLLEVSVETKAKGKECLDKVCELLGIIESDYMGLQYTGSHGEVLWVNQRNQLRRQLPGPPPYYLSLRVKFFVPPHLVLQDVTRHHFFLDVRNAFLESRLRAVSQDHMCHLAALVAQAEIGDCDVVYSSAFYQKFLPSTCLESGLPQLRVRWRSGGDHNSNDIDARDAGLSNGEEQQISIEMDRTAMDNLCHIVQQKHLCLKSVQETAAIYQFLKEVSELEDFGIEQFIAKSNGETFRIGVGPTGILIHDLNLELKHSISYTSMSVATHTAGRCFFIQYLNDSGETQILGFRLENNHYASALYRAVTEKHAFYSCDTVRNAVTSQYCRDLKGTIASIFNENTALGKSYLFDIKRTCREVYDHTRRVIYQAEVGEKSADVAADVDEAKDEEMTSPSKEKCDSPECKVIKEQLATFQDSILCRICMDSDVDIVFFPCRHVACCSTCSPLCENCPLCRTFITDKQHVYLPYTDRKVTKLKDAQF